MNGMFRIDGRVSIDNSTLAEIIPTEAGKLIITASDTNEPFAFLQHNKPLTVENPCFFVQINDLSMMQQKILNSL